MFGGGGGGGGDCLEERIMGKEAFGLKEREWYGKSAFDRKG